MNDKALSAVQGWGCSALSRKSGPTISGLARDAVGAAIADAGLGVKDIDGLILCQSDTLITPELSIAFRHELDFDTLSLLVVDEGKGTTMLQAIQHASMAIQAGMARYVVCVFSDTPIREQVGAGESFARPSNIMNLPGWERQLGGTLEFVAAGETSPGGSLPVNTRGGQLSGFYLQGATPLHEAVVQASATAGERQVPKHDMVFVSNSGG